MNNRELYRNAFSKVHASEDMTMEVIMKNKKRPVRANRRFVTICAMVILVLAMGITVNAASGGAISNYFSRVLGVEQEAQLVLDDQDPIDLKMKDLKIGIYDGNQDLIKELDNTDARTIDFNFENQTCTIDGNRYDVIFLVTVERKTFGNYAHGHLRLYSSEDYDKATENLELPDGTYWVNITDDFVR